jgi:hypothetical protein
MALRSVATTDTLGTFRTTFNTLATDVGDLSGLLTTAQSSLVGAVNEVLNTSFSFTLRDSTSSTQAVSQNDTLNVVGDTNISVTVSAVDTLTVNLNSSITGLTSITSGSIQITGSSIDTTDSSSLSLQNTINITPIGTITGVASLTGSGTANFTTDVQVNSVSVATKPFAIAQAIALG